ncbi:MAG: Crp/Fnr family transcriptional regulator [Lachnospiraceae bacterium]|nr:Crp/Fnr family transcriptional regulator [Lachnospiraceae bacterium]
MESVKQVILSGKTMKALIKCFEPKIREFQKGEVILRKSANESRLCLLLKGTAYLCIENEYADKQLLDFFTAGQMFYYEMLPSPHNGHCYIHAKHPCVVAYLEPEQLRAAACRGVENDPVSQISGLFRSIAADRNEHCHMLQQKTIRGKLLAFLYYQAFLQGSRTVRVPIPYSDLADYLTIDRSSLMTELGKMHTEGLIEKKAHTISLLL